MGSCTATTDNVVPELDGGAGPEKVGEVDGGSSHTGELQVQRLHVYWETRTITSAMRGMGDNLAKTDAIKKIHHLPVHKVVEPGVVVDDAGEDSFASVTILDLVLAHQRKSLRSRVTYVQHQYKYSVVQVPRLQQATIITYLCASVDLPFSLANSLITERKTSSLLANMTSIVSAISWFSRLTQLSVARF